MKKAVVGILKVGVPLAIGVYLVYYFYDALDAGQRAQLFDAFRQADLTFLFLSVAAGVLSHMVRGYRWRYLLAPLGHRPHFWTCYHAVMIGYFMNLFLPRAGEASRAATLYRNDRVPFEQGFGTILAERAVDMLLLLGIAGVTLLLQLDKLDLFQQRIVDFRMAQGRAPDEGSGLGWWVLGGLVVLGATAAYIVLTRPALRARVMEAVRGLGEGLRTVFHTPHKAAFVGQSLLIWALYFAMFWVGFFALPATAEVPVAGVLAGFIAGAVGIVLVQGGIGVYPAFVGLIVSVYMASPQGGGVLRPEALAMGWLLWVAQTLMVIVLGGLSLLLMALKRPPLT